MSPGVLKNIQWCRLDLQLAISQLCLLLISSPSSPSTSWCERLLLNIQREHDVQRLVQMSTLDVIANILSWWLIESIRVFNFSVWFGHFGARRSSSNRNHEMILTAQLNTEKLRQSLKPETDPESELLPSGWQRLLENWEIFVLFIRFSWMWPKTIFPPQLDTKLVFFCFLFSIWGGMVKVRVGLDTYNYLVKFKERLQFGLERLCTGHGYGHQLFLSIESWVG